MRATRITRWAGVAAVVTAQALHAQGAPPAQAAAAPAAAPAQPPSACGNTAFCTETNDFAAVITNFRTSDFRGYKMIDIVMHFVNKTPKSLVLGYVQNSGTIIDDKGNRYVVWGANGVRGIGQVYGGSFDPKFTLDGGGSGDAQFELAWYPGQQIYGFNFALDLAIDEINSYEGGQHSLGGEFPLHFQGLTNGISSGGQVAVAGGGAGGASGGGGGGGAAGGQPCNNGGAAGTATAVANATGSQAVQGAAAQGASTVAQATTAVQSLASIFSKKKSQPNKPAAKPCDSASGTVTQSAAGSVASPTAPAGGASAAQANPATTTATGKPATTATPAKPATSTDAAAMKAGGVRPGTTPPVTQPTTKTAPPTATTPHNTAPRTGTKKTVTPDTTKHP
ncbi:MAG TPA: hypothetical protein VL157_11400 [Gemmatimonadaceae bacterium]|jgi:hypothetical protein|nr:hypothetical protein [Gemmatimonadaceae bacterium]